MKRLPVALSALAGFVDAVGYLSLGGLYVAFMSGNSTLLSIGVAAGVGRVGLAAGLVGAFVAGVAAGTLLGRRLGAARPAGVLVFVAALLAGASVLHAAGVVAGAGLVMALAMGAENTVFQKEGQSGIGLTYMTGTLVRLGQRLAEALVHGDFRPVAPDLLLWGGMLAGAVMGGLAFEAVGVGALWVAAGAALGMGWVAWRGGRAGGSPP